MPHRQMYDRLFSAHRCTRCGKPKTPDRINHIKCLSCYQDELVRRKVARLALSPRRTSIPIASRNSRVINMFLDPTETRVGVLDIESTGLFGDFDLPLCVVIKTFGKNEHFVSTIDMGQSLLSAEIGLLEEVKEAVSGYDGIITYYGSNFDIPFLRTRMLANGIEPIGKLLHLDLYYTARGKLRLSRNRLNNVIELLRFSDKSIPSKTRVEPEYWVRATFGRDENALGYIIQHCIEDVGCLEAATIKLRDFLPDKVSRR